ELDLGERRLALAREWLVTIGLGGYASGTLGGAASRRHHGLLIASLPPPYGRRLLLGDVMEHLVLPEGRAVPLGGADGDGFGGLTEFRLELGLPVWRYEIGDIAIEKRVVLPHGHNTVHVVYRLLGGAASAVLTLSPIVHHRSHDAPVHMPLPGIVSLEQRDDRYELAVLDLPRVCIRVRGANAALGGERGNLRPRHYAIEESRGFRQCGVPWTPGFFRVEITAAEPAALVASTEPWETAAAVTSLAALEAERARRLRLLESAGAAADDPLGAELVLAADQFIVAPARRVAHGAGEERAVIAGYHWLTEWGRDTMVALEGLALATGRHAEAEHVLRTFTRSMRDGLVPNLFPEGRDDGLYHSADATLWLFHALDRYLATTGDRALLETLLPQLIDVAQRHVSGTRFGIAVDPDDGLLEQGAEGYQLTWMNAKIDDWVVTPRRGKAVEINALWYNALCLLAQWLEEANRPAEAGEWRELAAQVKASFNARFWNDTAGYLYDLVDGELGSDAACRPNQILAISLPNPVLERRYWGPVLDVVRERLLTPYGLRSLTPGHKDYRARYEGDMYNRDAALHQGTVWPWLMGPFIDAWLKTRPDEVEAAQGFLAAFAAHLHDACLGTVGEVFDAEPPHAPGGCIAQAWSVGEVLRAWLEVRAALALREAAPERRGGARAASPLGARAGPRAVAAEERPEQPPAAARRP
ncbi:MAG TPA: amylo-alpha-1,6-glucosidase, partial [Gammaproteobacteria bacterium]|nr:amylo-alpha-1,6-glucosidase [Gammaproteobacteria bacterium]